MRRACSDCGGSISRTSSSGRCRTCYAAAGYLGIASTGTEAGIPSVDYGTFASEQGSSDLLAALRRYCEVHHPGAAWLREAR